jgi:hypothetical protein
MIFWLVLVLYGPNEVTVQKLHVGNFPTMAACQAAAKSAQFTNATVTGPSYEFICVQANVAGTSPPN